MRPHPSLGLQPDHGPPVDIFSRLQARAHDDIVEDVRVIHAVLVTVFQSAAHLLLHALAVLV